MNTKDKNELLALIDYLIKHNKHHNDELVDLNASIKECNGIAYQEVLKALECFSNGNTYLENALKELKK